MEDICHCGVKHGGQLTCLMCFNWYYMPMCRQLRQDFHWSYSLESLDKCVSLHGGHFNLGFLILCCMSGRLDFCLQLRMRYPELVSSVAQIATYHDTGAGVLRLRSCYHQLRVCTRQSASLCCRISVNISWLSPDLVILASVLHCSVMFWSEHCISKTTNGWRILTSISRN